MATATPSKKMPGSKDFNAKTPASLSVGKSGPAGKGSAAYKHGKQTAKEQTSTGTAKKPQKL